MPLIPMTPEADGPYALSDTPTGALLMVSADGQAVASEQAMAVLEAMRNKAVLELEHYSLELEHDEDAAYYHLCGVLYPGQMVLPGSPEEARVQLEVGEETARQANAVEAKTAQQGFYEPFDEGDAIEQAYERQGNQHALKEVRARLEVLNALRDYAQHYGLEPIAYGVFHIKNGCVKLEIEAGYEQ